MWPFNRRSNIEMQVAVRPHPSRLLRAGARHSKTKNQTQNQPELMVIIIRDDVKLSTNRVVKYATTVAVRLVQRVCRKSSVCQKWNSTQQPKNILRITGESALDEVIQKAGKIGVPCALVQDRVKNEGKEEKVKTMIGMFGSQAQVGKLVRGLKPF